MAKKELRGYQIDWVAEIDERLRAAPAARVMGQMPTGGGKTVSACAVIEHWLAERPQANVWWVTHRKELIDQSAAALAAEGVATIAGHATSWPPGQGRPFGAGVIVTSPLVLRNRRGLAGGTEDDLLVLDEAHHAAAQTWTDLLKAHPGPALGLTATPWRLSRKEGFEGLFSELVTGPQTSDLIAAGALSGFQMFGPPLGGTIAGEAEDKNSTGEFSEGKVYRRYSPTVLLDNAYDLWMRYGGPCRQTLVYALTVVHAENIVELWRSRGKTADLITAETPAAQRDAVMRDYRAGAIETLVNVGIATEGFDIPAIGCVLVLRPTASLALYLQMMGRGLRPDPTGDGRLALLLDMTDNPHRLGRPDVNREWSLSARGDPTAAAGAEVSKTCWAGYVQGDPEASDPCMAINPAGAHVCVDCGAPFGEVCPFCGSFRSWASWLPGADRCESCLKGEAHAHLTYLDPWRISKRGNDYRPLDSRQGADDLSIGITSRSARPG